MQSRTETKVTKVSNEAYSKKLDSFAQCPINGLRTVNPANLTPSNYNNSCSVAPDESYIGYGTNKDNSPNGLLGGGRLTSQALDAYMLQLCANVKNDSANILVYTLTLGSDVTAAAKTVMCSCASSPDAYFDVTDGSKLPEVFAEIAGTLTELRLTPPPADKKGT